MKTKRQPLLRWPQQLVRATAWAVLLTFSSNIIIPTLVIAKEADRRAELMAAPKRTEFDDVTTTLIQLEDALDRMNRRLQGQWEYEWQVIANRGGQTPPPVAADRAALRALEDELDASVPRLESLQGAVRAYFAQTRQHIERSNLAPEILARHDDSTAEYERSYGELKSLLHALKTAHTPDEFKTTVAAAHAFMQQHSSKPLRAAFDPNAPLAFGPGKARAGEPRTDGKAMRAALGMKEPDAKTLARDADLKAAPTAAELAPTEDAPLSDAIRAKATELGNNPVAIYNFVRNGIEFLPTYGSIQGAEQTLKTLRGNAFDQSSLLIALLRASGIPARYVYGTIELPIDQVQNWVGGTETPLAALELLGAGGIPNLGLAQGGVIKKAQIEHVWVEAFVDFVPSRGAKNITGDSWVPMDASFKQYEYTDGTDLESVLDFDAQAFADRVKGTSNVNEAEGWVQGIDTDYVQTQLEGNTARLANFLEGQDNNATLGEIIGSKSIRTESPSMLSGSNSYTVTATASRSSQLPDSVRWKFRFALDGTRLIEQSLPQLAGKLMAVSFKPATAADETALKSWIPSDADSLEDLPTSIPTSLVKLTARFSINGQTVASGATRQIGTEVITRKGLFIPGQGWQETDNPLTFGDYQAVGLDVAGLSRADLQAQQSLLDSAREKLESHAYDSMTEHEFAGSFLQAGLTTYFAETHVKSRIAAQASGMLFYRLPSYGTVASESQVQYWFGVPRSFAPKGVLIDMDRMASVTASKDGDNSKWVGFNRSIGYLLSAHEHGALEKLVDDRNPNTAKVEGVSAVKALAVAAAAGQRIYTIKESNLAVALSAVNLPVEVEREIADAVYAGKIVTTHQSPVTYGGQVTSGFVVLDQETGAGAFKIYNGADGGLIQFVLTLLIVLGSLLAACFALSAALAAGSIGLIIFTAFIAIYELVSAIFWIIGINEATTFEEFSQNNFITVMGALLGDVLLVPGLLALVGANAFVLLLGAFLAVELIGWFT